MIKNFPISGSKVMVILLKGCILLIGGASAGEGLRLQPAQQACLYKKISFSFVQTEPGMVLTDFLFIRP